MKNQAVQYQRKAYRCILPFSMVPLVMLLVQKTCTWSKGPIKEDFSCQKNTIETSLGKWQKLYKIGKTVLLEEEGLDDL